MTTWNYKQNFDGLNTGNLSGQDGYTDYSTDVSIQVQESVYYQGSKATGVTLTPGQSAGIRRAMSQYADGVVKFVMRVDGYCGYWGEDSYVFFCSDSGAGFIVSRMADDGIYLVDVDYNWKATLTSSISEGVFYEIIVEWDCSIGTNGQYRAKMAGGSWTSWYEFSEQTSYIDLLYFWHYSDSDADSSVSFYHDDIDTLKTFVSLDKLSLTGSAKTLGLLPGSVSPEMDKLTASGSAKSLSVSPGTVSPGMDLLLLSGSTKNLGIVPGSISLEMDKLTASGTIKSLLVSPGAVSSGMDLLSMTAAAKSLVVALTTSVSLQRISAALSAKDLSITTGAISVVTNILNGSLSVKDLLAVPGGITKNMDRLEASGQARGISVIPGMATITLDLLGCQGFVKDASVSMGEIAVSIDTLSLVAGAKDLTLRTYTTIQVQALNGATEVKPFSVSAGPVSLLLDTLEASGQVLDVVLVYISKELEVLLIRTPITVAFNLTAPITPAIMLNSPISGFSNESFVAKTIILNTPITRVLNLRSSI